MKTNTAFDKIVIDTARDKKSKFGLAHDVNTTASIGDTQPLLCRLLVPKSKTTLSSRHMLRMAPMVVPTFGRLKAKYWNHFVGMSDLLPRCFPALLAKTPIAKGDASALPAVPFELPSLELCNVSLMCLVGCSMTVYFHDPYSTEGPDDSYTRWRSYAYNDSAQAVTDFKSWIASYVTYGTLSGFSGFTGGIFNPSMFGTQFAGGSVPFNVAGAAAASSAYDRLFYPISGLSNRNLWEPVTLNSADYVIRTAFTEGGNTYEISFAIRLSAFGKRIRKILLGLGYQINFTGAHSKVSLMPLFAYYKAYFDTFGLTLYDNWESSAASILLQSWDNQDLNAQAYTSWSTSYGTWFRRFVYDLGTTYVTENQDYISAHTKADVIEPNGSPQSDNDINRGFVNNIVLGTYYDTAADIPHASQYNVNMGITGVSDRTGHVYINKIRHTEVDAQLLKTLYKWTNRQTIAGRRIAELLIAGGYGDYVKNCKSNFIGYEELDIDVTDVNATADSTNAVTGHNSVVGEYVGKGIGVTQGDAKSFSFENDEFGYWISIFAVVPESGYTQSLDLTLLDVTADDIYNRDFDGLGMELQPKSVVLGSTDWQSKSDSTQYEASFGMVPRHSRYKVSHNIANGDFSLRGVRANYLPFSLDKYIDIGNRECILSNSSNYQYSTQKGVDVSGLPIAGNTWRYINRYQWLNNFERIFTNFQGDAESFKQYVIELNNLASFELCYQLYDHFICQNILDLVTYAPMLPISESYGTTDENDGNGDKVFTKA